MTIQVLSHKVADLLAIATARLDSSGVLLEANAGFLRLLGDGGAHAVGTNVARFFMQPGFTFLARDAPSEQEGEYRGLLTIGDYAVKTRSLRGRVWRAGDDVLLLAEFDIEELERITERVLELNGELNASQRALAQANNALKQREAQIVETSLTDALTGVGNRRKLEQALAAEMSRARRQHGPLSALMMDLDHFKRVNDQYGHGGGDKVLVRFSELLRAQTRPTDIVARYGGEEFVVLLPHTDLACAAALGERIRRIVGAETIAPVTAPVTVSIGAAQLRADDTGDALLDRADAALYRAKEGGRDRVAVEW